MNILLSNLITCTLSSYQKSVLSGLNLELGLVMLRRSCITKARGHCLMAHALGKLLGAISSCNAH